jgi:hypothetical protein
MNQKSRQIRTTLEGSRLAEFDALIDHLGLNPSAVLKLAVRRLALVELGQKNQRAFPDSTEKAA